MLQARRIPDLHDRATASWHDAGAVEPATDSPSLALILEQHRANFELWHWEDAARDPLATESTIAGVKHAIDAVNQRRNDLVEQVDTLLFRAVEQNADAPLHSETPGLIVDRLSILALKLFHTRDEMERPGVSEAHRQRNAARLEILVRQRSELVHCLHALWAEVVAGSRQFKLYRQLKMYNDPALNPVMYRAEVLAKTPSEEKETLVPGTGH